MSSNSQYDSSPIKTRVRQGTMVKSTNKKSQERGLKAQISRDSLIHKNGDISVLLDENPSPGLNGKKEMGKQVILKAGQSIDAI